MKVNSTEQYDFVFVGQYFRKIGGYLMRYRPSNARKYIEWGGTIRAPAYDEIVIDKPAVQEVPEIVGQITVIPLHEILEGEARILPQDHLAH